jgi:glutamate 5-kinase
MKKIVIKIGSSIIAPKAKLNPELIDEIIQNILGAEKLGYKMIIVSSGAIACGAAAMGINKRPQQEHSLMALASLGQIILMEAWAKGLRKYAKNCAQILLSWDDFDHRRRFLNARGTIDKLLKMNVVPIINENDAISCDEIKFGDNDRLSALVTDLTGAVRTVIFSDIPGLLDADNKVIPIIENIDAGVFGLVRKKKTGFTSGGMQTKLEAAKIVVSSGAILTITNFNHENKEKIISRIINGENIGTNFLPPAKLASARQRWIAFSKKVKGKIFIDDGAKEAVLNKGKSLLCVGIIKVDGEFKRRDSVQVVDKCGNILGCGMVNYACEELNTCAGKKIDREVIHHNDFVRNI